MESNNLRAERSPRTRERTIDDLSDQTDSRKPRLQPLFEYPDLELKSSTFRVLELFPAEDQQDPLVGALHVECHAHDEKDTVVKPYEAISYVWGNCELDKHNVLSGSFGHIYLQGRVLPLSPNLENALRVFRRSDRSRRLWADAICINQSDRREQTHQVAMMMDIYRYATRTLAWLGSTEQSWDPAPGFFGALEKVARGEHTTLNVGAFDYFESQVYGWLPQVTVPKTSGYEMLEPLVYLPYFSRRWVLQEVGVAREITFHYQRYTIDGQDLAKAFAALISSEDYPPLDTYYGFIACLEMAVPFSAQTQDNDASDGSRILAALDQYRGFDCKDPRDRISALLWVVPEANRFKVEYDSSVREVYIEFAQMILQSSWYAIWCLLHSASSRTGRCPNDIPSWVPDWRTRPIPDSEVHLETSSKARGAGKYMVTIIKSLEDTSCDTYSDTDARLTLSLRHFHVVRRSISTSNDNEEGVLQTGDYILDVYPNRPQATNTVQRAEFCIVLRPHGNAWRIVRAVKFWDFETPWDDDTVAESHVTFTIV